MSAVEPQLNKDGPVHVQPVLVLLKVHHLRDRGAADFAAAAQQQQQKQ